MLTLLLLSASLLPTAALAQTGLLIVAHGAGPDWNGMVRETAAQVRWTQGSTQVAFLMGPESDVAGWDSAVARLTRDGARAIVVVPLLVSSFGAHYRQIQSYAGEAVALPAELAAHDHHGTRGAPPVPTRVARALDAAPEVGEALASRWSALGTADRGRALVLVAHGPESDADAVRWLENLSAAEPALRGAGLRGALRIALLRDDAPAAVRGAAVAAMRDTIAALASRSMDSVVVMPVLIAGGDILRRRIPEDLAGAPVRYVPVPLTPHPAIARWIARAAAEAQAVVRETRLP